MPAHSIYLDNNSTTPIDPRVVEAMVRAWTDCGANPASQHAPGRQARRMLEEAREGIAELLGAKTGGMDADRVIFTSGGTEANNLALIGLAGQPDDRVVTSWIEHPSVLTTTRERRRLVCKNNRSVPDRFETTSRNLAAVARAKSEPYATDSDDQLLRQVRAGNSAAILQLHERYFERAKQFIQSIVGCPKEAQYLASDTLVQLFFTSKDSPVAPDAWELLQTVARAVVRTHARIYLLPVRENGVVNVKPLDTADSKSRLASLMVASNESGVIQSIEDFSWICRERGVISHTDAVQAVGKIPVHFRNLGVDAMTVAPHKFHGSLGIGALVLKHGVELQPQLVGGFQQEGLRPGTENVALAVGFHKALELAVKELPERAERMRELRDRLERSLAEEFAELVIIGKDAPRLPNTSCVSFPGLNRQALVMALDLAGVACSTGSACASGSSEPSPTLVAMGLPKDVIEGAIRLSLGAFTTAAEVAEAARRILKTVKHLRSQNSG